MVLVASVLASSRAWAAEPPAGPLSLSIDEAIQTAFRNNKEIQAQAKEVEVGRAQILGARSRFLPHVSANGGYTHNGWILSLGSAAGMKKDPGIFTGFNDDNKAGISVEQTVYNGGADLTQFKQAQKNLKAQEQALRVKKQDIAFETKRLYCGLLLAQETERIAQEMVDLAQTHYEDVKKRFDAGTVSKFDVLQSRVQVSKLTPELIRSKNAVELIAAELGNLLGLQIEEPLNLKDKLVYSLVTLNEKELQKLALLGNPELALQTLGVDLNKLGIDLARSGGRPQVSAGLGNSYRSNDLGNMFNDRHQNWSAGFTVSVPIFDGFSSKAKVDEAKARYSQALLYRDDLVDQITVRVKQAVLDLHKAEALIDSQKDNIEQAKEALCIAQVRYENGEGTNLDVMDTQVSLSAVQKNYSEGIYAYLMAQAFVSKVLGGDVKDAAGAAVSAAAP